MKKPLTAQQERDMIRNKVGHYAADEPPIRYWMDTGEEELHAVLGSRKKGIPYGKLIEIFGNESNGKSVLAIDLGAQGQSEGAEVAVIDFESSWDPDWARVRGLDPDKVVLFEPYIGKFKRKKKKVLEKLNQKDEDDEEGEEGGGKERLSTAEELCEEFERWVEYKHRQNPKGKIVAIFDSVAAMLVDVEAAGGITDQNMRTNYGLPAFLSKILRRWIAMARNNNALLIFVNQVRTKPTMFGNPEQSVGGKALRFYCHIRAEVRRSGSKGGVMKKNGKQIGIKGIIYNVKNKSGGGSIEREQCGFKFFWSGHSKFVKPSEIKEKT